MKHTEKKSVFVVLNSVTELGYGAVFLVLAQYPGY